MTGLLRPVVALGSAGAAAAAVRTALGARQLLRPPSSPAPVAERVAVLLPVRDEAVRVAPCLAALLASRGVPALTVHVYDDGSRDGTADVVRATAGTDPRLRLHRGRGEPPPGWLGKPHACARLAEAALAEGADVLVLVDADVVVAPAAVAASVALLRGAGLDLVSPYPRQLADGALPRLVQPLLQWSWLSSVPLRRAYRSRRESLAVANGQLLVVDAAAYARAGGHAGPTVRGAVVEDVALLRAVVRSGGHGGVADGTGLAVCRMYETGAELAAGYGKSLHAAVGPAPAAAAVAALLAVLFVLPPVAAVVARDRPTRALGAAGYAAGVAGRVVTARRTGGRVWPDAAAHPASVAVLLVLGARSRRAARRGALTWKGRAL